MLTADNYQDIGLEKYPEFQATADGFGVPNLPAKINLVDQNDPSAVKGSYTVSWSVDPPEATDVPGYEFQEKDTGTGTDWYYMLLNDFTFEIDLRGLSDSGEVSLENRQLVQSILKNFWLERSNGKGAAEDFPIDNFDFQVNNDNTIAVTIKGLWAYAMDDGAPFSYSVIEKSGDGKLTDTDLGDWPALDEEDYLQINYKAGEGDTVNDRVTNGGALQLIRSGVTSYSAEKVWMDEWDNMAEPQERPEPTFTLYRYTMNADDTMAGQPAPVLEDLNGAHVGAGELVKAEDGQSWKVVFRDTAGNDCRFPKYDPDGRRYIYGAKEDALSEYEQIFGRVGADGNVEEGTDTGPNGNLRPEGDAYLYQDGVLTNRKKNTVTVPVTKTWDAKAYQSQFDDVAVEVTLQVQQADGTWKNYLDPNGEPVVRYLDDFYAEKLTDTDSASVPQYDQNGKPYTYRWRETAVYADDEKINPENRIPIIDDRFTLNNAEYTVEYKENGNIINRVTDTLDYVVEKQWADGTLKTDVTINIYRALANEGYDFTKPYVTFTVDKDGGLASQEPTNIVIKKEVPQEGSWRYTIQNLPRFDQQGRPYQYLLLEENGFPVYETTVDENGNYKTVVINGEGGDSIPILVQKDWVDDNDAGHREPVTLTIYSRETDLPIKVGGKDFTVTLGEVTADDPASSASNLWHEVVRVPIVDKNDDGVKDSGDILDINDLYVVETRVGSNQVDHHLQEYSYQALYINQEGDNGEIFDVSTANHRYQELFP